MGETGCRTPADLASAQDGKNTGFLKNLDALHTSPRLTGQASRYPGSQPITNARPRATPPRGRSVLKYSVLCRHMHPVWPLACSATTTTTTTTPSSRPAACVSGCGEGPASADTPAPRDLIRTHVWGWPRRRTVCFCDVATHAARWWTSFAAECLEMQPHLRTLRCRHHHLRRTLAFYSSVPRLLDCGNWRYALGDSPSVVCPGRCRVKTHACSVGGSTPRQSSNLTDL